MKKAISTLTILALVLSMGISAPAEEIITPQEANASFFIDVPADHWAFNEIQFFNKAGIVAGIGENTFAPEENVTREQFAKLLALLFSMTDYIATEQTFSDVTSDMWSYNYIEAVKRYLTGYYPTGAKPFFNPAAKASREDIAYSLVKITGLGEEGLKDQNILSQFSDSDDISPALKKYIGIAIENGLIRGYDGKFRPQDSITRAETVVLLFRALKAPVNQGPSPTPDLTNTPVPVITPAPTTPAVTAPPTQSPKPDSEYQYDIETTDIRRISGYETNSSGKNGVSGRLTLKWSPNENKAVFEANLWVKTFALSSDECNVSLIELISCSDNTIEGYFNVVLDNEVKDERIKGKIVISNKTLTLTTEPDNYNLVAGINITFAEPAPTSAPQPTDEPPNEPPKNDELKKVQATTITSNTPILFKTSDMTDAVTPDSGTAEIYWREDGAAFLDATYQLGEDVYTFACVSIFQVNEEGYHGMFEIKKNGTVVETVDGKIYAPAETSGVYPYFKFYSYQEIWHFSGQITRINTESINTLE